VYFVPKSLALASSIAVSVELQPSTADNSLATTTREWNAA
jgi:hypothetical protein